jgi:hypothetical protein
MTLKIKHNHGIGVFRDLQGVWHISGVYFAFWQRANHSMLCGLTGQYDIYEDDGHYE